ncbi:MAG: RagB/SusD family nutrient uptake outer membrane protein [Bacteroides sp.]|nr:RagB/SusD family nutrient uptake outer membrane protein [Bacteroides sp.]
MKRIKHIIALIVLTFSLHSCFDLDEKVFSDLAPDIYYQNEESVQAVVARIYHSGFYAYQEWFWYLQEFSADQVAWRSWNNGLWGYDEGYKFVLSTHTWTPQSTVLKDAWEKAWQTIGYANSALDDFSGLNPSSLKMTEEQLQSYVDEVRTLRAWSYYTIYEIWGGTLPLNISVGIDIPPSADTDFDTGCKKIFDFMVTELDESLTGLPVNAVNRMNQAVNRMIKARLMLNANVFIKEERYGECKTICEEILAGKYGNYELAADHRSIYAHDNHTCPEVIMAYACDPSQLNADWLRVLPFMPYNFQDYFGAMTGGSAWNCVCLAPSYDNSASLMSGGTPRSFLEAPYNDKLGAVYERFHDKDIRKGNYIFDENTNLWSGMFLRGAIRANYGTGSALTADADREGQALVYVDQVGPFAVQGTPSGKPMEDVLSARWGETNSGVRLVKYPMYPSSSGLDYREADEVEFRLAEVVFMLAECKMREGDLAGGKDLVNSVRKRYFSAADWSTVQNDPGPGFTAFDLDWMLNQWGQEFLSEGRRRRTDLRRFDQFTQGQWWFFGRTSDDGFAYPAQRDRKYEWFPLPETALNVNPGLVQNPDYVN